MTAPGATVDWIRVTINSTGPNQHAHHEHINSYYFKPLMIDVVDYIQ